METTNTDKSIVATDVPYVGGSEFEKTSDTPNALHIKIPFARVHEELENVTNVDMVSAGVSPATVRFLTSKNKYINVGLTETVVPVKGNSHTEAVVGECMIEENNNSYEVTQSELFEVHEAIVTHFNKLDNV